MTTAVSLGTRAVARSTRPLFGVYGQSGVKWGKATGKPYLRSYTHTAQRFLTSSTGFGRQQQALAQHETGQNGLAKPRETSEKVRHLMRSVAHPVAIVTASPESGNSSGRSTNPRHWRGATVSSFVTVAMDPSPVICFNIKQDSSTFHTLNSSRRFNIHVLASNAVAEEVATKFAGGNALEPFHDGEGNLEWWVEAADSEDGHHPSIRAKTNEVEAEEDSFRLVLFRLHCAILPEHTVHVGDHVVVFGEVLSTNDDEDAAGVEKCLIYVNGRYSEAKDR